MINENRLSLCIGTASVKRVLHQRRSMRQEAKAITLNTTTLVEVSSWEALQESEEGLSYYREGSWLHLKFIQLEDR